MNVTAIVPIKRNNRRMPHKNTTSFTDGKPLCHYVLRTLTRIDAIDATYVYCSDPAICGYLPEGVTFLRRDPALDRDETTVNDILLAFAETVDSDVYVMSHATSPFVSKESIETGLDAVLSGAYDSAFAVRKLQDFLWNEQGPVNYRLDAIPRTQDLPPLFVETSGFYIFTKRVLLELRRRIGQTPRMVEVSAIEGIDIDEPEDFRLADAVWTRAFRDGSRGETT